MRRINLLLLLILVTLGSYAQDSLRFTNTSFNTFLIDTSGGFTITDSIYNYGIAPVTDSVAYRANLNSSVYSGFSVTPQILPADTLYTGVSKQITITIDTAQQFLIGPNTIVIWPVIYHGGSPVSGTTDSIYITVTYDTIHTGIAGSSLIRMYIFETPGRLNINFGDAQNLVQQVRIYDVIGQSIYTGSPEKSEDIPTAGWNAGIYLCEISTFTGEKRIIKFRIE